LFFFQFLNFNSLLFAAPDVHLSGMCNDNNKTCKCLLSQPLFQAVVAAFRHLLQAKAEAVEEQEPGALPQLVTF
jgi:hypothetical protein